MNITESIINYIRMIGEFSLGDADCKAIDDAVLSIFEIDCLIQDLIKYGYDNETVLDSLGYSIKLDFKQLQLIYEDLDIPVLI